MKRTDVITYYGPICEYGIGKLIEITLTAISAGSNEICLHLDSQGGDLQASFTAYEHLRSLNTKLVTHNLNQIVDDALLLYLAGDDRTATPDASWVLSDFDMFFGNRAVNSSVAVARSDFLELNKKRFAKIFNTCCRNSLDICDRFLNEKFENLIHVSRHIMGVTDALDAGITTLPPAPTSLDRNAMHWFITPGSIATK